LRPTRQSTLNPDFPFKYYPWFYFLLFCAANSLLAYGSLSLAANLFIFLFGLLVPMAVAFGSRPPSPSVSLYQINFFESIPLWFWCVIGAAALFARLAQVTFWAPWLGSDESTVAFYSVQLSQNWFWHFFWGSAQNPSFFNWGLAIFYKIITPGLFSTNFYTIIISGLTAGITYWSARSVFSKSLSAFCLMVSATGFWLLYSGGHCFIHILALFWQIALLGFLGRLAKGGSKKEIQRTALALGMITGSGFLIAIAWPVVVVVTFLALAGLWIKKKPREAILPFLVPFMGWVLLFLLAAVHEHYGQHFSSLWLLRSGTDWIQRWPDFVSNFTALFWRNFAGGFGPTWGGMLNPILSSLFFMGLVELKAVRASAFTRWILVGLLLGLAPGFLSKSFDIFRSLHSFPFQVVIAGLGFQRLLEASPRPRALILALFIFLAFTPLDLWHDKLSAARMDPTAENFAKSYEILEKKYAPLGPGLILSDLMPRIWNHSLDVATYSFNAVANPRIPVSQVRWVALLENEEYVPFLNRRFDQIHWYALGGDDFWKTGRLCLGVVPIQPGMESTVASWLNADLYIRALILEFLKAEPFMPPQSLIEGLREMPLGEKPDPFLESSRDERILFSLPPGDPSLALLIARQGLTKGYPLSLFQRFQGNDKSKD
jgi:hypothetical protein